MTDLLKDASSYLPAYDQRIYSLVYIYANLAMCPISLKSFFSFVSCRRSKTYRISWRKSGNLLLPSKNLSLRREAALPPLPPLPPAPLPPPPPPSVGPSILALLRRRVGSIAQPQPVASKKTLSSRPGRRAISVQRRARLQVQLRRRSSCRLWKTAWWPLQRTRPGSPALR